MTAEPKSTMTELVADQIPAACTILAVISIVGTIGNLLVLYVYGVKNDRQTATLFIIVLAAADFTACLVIIPVTIVVEQFDWKLMLFVCKTYYVLNSTGITFSSLLISAIALDRYLCICHPFLHIMTIRRAKIIISCLASFSLMIGVMSSFQMRSKIVSYLIDLPDNTTEVRTEEECYEVTAADNSNTTTYETIFYHVTQKTQTIDFLLCILSVITLYVLIFRSVLRMRRKREELKGLRLKKTTTPVGATNTTGNDSPGATCTVQLLDPAEKDCTPNCHAASCKTHNIENGQTEPLNTRSPVNGGQDSNNLTQLPSSNPCEDPSNRNHLRKPSAKHVRDTHLFQNLKTAMMLFVVAVVYIITFLPASLMANSFINLYLPVFYLYYINSAANPIIYCFMNKNFRDDITKLFCPNRIIRR